MDIAKLFMGFFRYFGYDFNWSEHAVCMRLNGEGIAVDKYSLATPTTAEQWYIEDPFDLKHNLAGKCSKAGQRRIIKEMQTAHDILQRTGDFAAVFATKEKDSFYLKC